MGTIYQILANPRANNEREIFSTYADTLTSVVRNLYFFSLYLILSCLSNIGSVEHITLENPWCSILNIFFFFFQWKILADMRADKEREIFNAYAGKSVFVLLLFFFSI